MDTRKKALIYDVPEKPIEISGPDATAFLDKVLTRKISDFRKEEVYTLSLHSKRRYIHGWGCFKFSNNKYWYVQADGDFETWLLAHTEGLM